MEMRTRLMHLNSLKCQAGNVCTVHACVALVGRWVARLNALRAAPTGLEVDPVGSPTIS
jgi:hypothetical protein